jgi:hypothetical protein
MVAVAHVRTSSFHKKKSHKNGPLPICISGSTQIHCLCISNYSERGEAVEFQ